MTVSGPSPCTAGHTPLRPRPGKVVAELSFGFWRYLVTPHYEQSFWVPALDHAFPNLTGGSSYDRRQHVEQTSLPCTSSGTGSLTTNRSTAPSPTSPDIGHGSYNLQDLHDLALELAGWISPAAATWLTTDVSQVDAILAERP
ncbi:MAG: hypothetical protein ACRDV9_11680 [Acidimicrobiia bacterium]